MAKRKRQKLSKKFIPQASIVSDEIYLPNHSGEHTAGTTGTPVNDRDIANKKYVDALVALYLPLTGGTLSGVLYCDGAPVGLDVLYSAEIGSHLTVGNDLDVGGAISSATATITASSDTTDVSGINTLFINITGDIVLGGLIGGVNGQAINIVMLGNFVNHCTIEHAEGIGGSQDFINHTALDEDISHGGSIYVCNGTNWYDTSHAKHV